MTELTLQQTLDSTPSETAEALQPMGPDDQDHLAERIAMLTPVKRQLLEMRLQQLRAAQSKSAESQRIQRRPPALSTSKPPLPLSYSQQRFWFLHELEPEIPLFNNARAWRVQGTLDARALEQALKALIERHEILRTTYRQDAEGQLTQIVSHDWEFVLPVVDLRHDPEREARVQQLLLADACRRFDLSSDLVLRATLYLMGEDDAIFCETHHHIATDFWSVGILRRELLALYEAIRHDQPNPLPELPLQYADFALWQRQQENSEGFRRQLDYWRQKLAGDLPRLAIAMAPPEGRWVQRSAMAPSPPSAEGASALSRRGASASLLLQPNLVTGLQDLGRSEGATLFMVMAAAFLALFHRYSRQDDLVVGVLSAGRTLVELEGLIGSFINALVYRVDLSGDPTFRQLVARVRQVGIEALANQDVPFERVVAETHPGRSAEMDPITGVIFDFLNAPANRLKSLDAEWTPVEIDKGSAEYDMLISARPAGSSGYSDGLILGIRFRTDLYSPEMVDRMLEHLTILIEGAIAQPERRVSELPLLSAAERQRLLIDWNDSALPFPRHLCFHQLFEQQARRTPAAIAACDPGGALSYAELNAHANRLAHGLLANGVQAGEIVALLAGRSTHFLIAMLGIWKAGAVYMPLDPRWPAPRLSQVMTQSQARWLLAGDEYETHVITTPGAQHLSLRALLQAEMPAHDPSPHTKPGDLAYVIYTSGSTGIPKGAMVEHQGMLNHLYAKIHDLDLVSADVVAQNSPQSFDISVWQFLVALLVGGQTRIFPDEVAFDPAALLEQVEACGITVFEAVPSLLRAMLDVAASDATAPLALSRMRWLIPTGEAMPPSLSRAWFARFPQLRQMNAYGPTECSDDVTHYRLDGPPGAAPTLPIGRPVANMRLYVLDKHLRPTPIGVPGEIYVGGVGVGRGYLNDPTRTAEAFLPDPFVDTQDRPFGQAPGQRLYRTGDLGRWLESGNIEFLGRVDFQVKVRGHRIELGEIESVLLQHPGVTESAVLALDGAQRLVAFLALGDGQALTASDAALHVRSALPSYMIPAAFVIFEAPASLPKTTSGKIDRKALAILAEGAASIAPKPGMAPRTPTEARIAAIWSELLNAPVPGVAPSAAVTPVLGIEDDFFDLGGHSLLAAQLVYRLRQEFDSDLPLRRLFETPTIAGLAAYLEGPAVSTPRSGGQRSEVAGEYTRGQRSPVGTSGVEVLRATSLLPLRPRGGKPPFFFLAGGGGSEEEYLTAYAGLIHRLGPDQPVYGFQTRGVADDLEPHPSVEAMAADFVTELRTVQPHGPYYLGGECIGGKLALEMARFLHEQGEEIALLVVLNGVVLGLARQAVASASNASERTAGHTLRRQMNRRLSELSRLPPRQRLGRLAGMARNTAAVLLPLTPTQRQKNKRRAARLHYTHLLQSHLPAPYAGDVTLLMTTDLAEKGHAEAWRACVRGVLNIQSLVGVHRTYLGEHIEANGATVRTRLEQAQG